ncbi:hypothetical protein B0H63DRAFT_386009 [Podospora didyma]|uniref:Rhodopsin domain-containing protein n=1 Tax=Podospora didyma TaxID=330526 RepID=A0AAE0U909_9PEZI|nr:hypothetical protein B0H63DRAFT_386009 [Podospora didyma]
MTSKSVPTDTLAPTVIACTTIMLCLSLLAVALRFYTRGKLMRAIGREDWCVLVALFFCIASTSLIFAEVHFALGQHIAAVTPTQLIGYLKVAFFQGVFYHLSLAFTKISILLLYLRVLVTYDYTRKLIWATLVIVAVYNAFTFVMHLNICTPLAKVWDRSVPGTCSDARIWWGITYMHIITDFIIFALPVPVVVGMTIPIRQKVALLFVFAMGFFVCLISVLRTIWLNTLLYSRDSTWDFVSIANWSAVEINIAVVCACLPTMKPLVTRFLSWLSSRHLPCWKGDGKKAAGDTDTQEHAGDQPGGHWKRRGGADVLAAAGLDDSTRPLTIGSMPLQAVQAARQGRGAGEEVITDGTLGLSTMDSDAGRGAMRSDVATDEATLWGGSSAVNVAKDRRSSFGGSSSAVEEIEEIAHLPKAHVKGRDAGDIV